MALKIIREFSGREILFAVMMLFIASCSAKAPYEQTRCVQSADGEMISYNVSGSGDITLVFVPFRKHYK